MKKVVLTVIVILFTLACFAEYTMSTVFTAKWGSGEGEYKIWEESPPIGPGPMVVDDEGNIFIIDLGNYRVKKYNKNGDFQKEIFIEQLQNRLLLLENRNLIVLRW